MIIKAIKTGEGATVTATADMTIAEIAMISRTTTVTATIGKTIT
jgi:hypothetical protein